MLNVLIERSCPAGVVNAGIQFVSFAGLLYLLLSLDNDPVLYAVRVLPISRAGQEQAAAAFSNAMRGVFLCAVKVPLGTDFRLCHAIDHCPSTCNSKPFS